MASSSMARSTSKGSTSLFNSERHIQHEYDMQHSRDPVDRPSDPPIEEPVASLVMSHSLPHELAIVGILCSAHLCTQIGLAQTLSILKIIGDSFGIDSPGERSWLIASYSLTVGTFILFSGRLGDLYGHKRMVVIGYSWFSLWTLVGGLAVYSNNVLFNFARALQGIGPSILIPNAIAILGTMYPPGLRKSMAFALFGACAPVGGAIGGAFGGLFALAWWPWAFWSFSIILAILAILSMYLVPDQPHESQSEISLQSHIRKVDLSGAVFGVLGLVLINFAWNQAPVTGWSTPYIYVILILGLLCIPLFFYNELRISENPLLPFDALTSDVAFMLACIAGSWSSFGIWYYNTWQILEQVRGASPLLAAAYFTPTAISGSLASVTTGHILNRIHPAWVMMIAGSCFVTGTLLMATVPIDQTYWAQIFVSMIIMPWGMDMSFPAAAIIMSNAVKKEHQGIAASLTNTIINYSISIGLGFAGTVETKTTSVGTTPYELLRGFRAGLYMGVGLSGLGLVISLLFLSIRVIFTRKSTRDKD